MFLKKKEEKLKNPKSVKELAYGMFTYTGSSILGPLIFFGLIGFYIDKYLKISPFGLIIAVVVSFIVTNFLIFKKMKFLINKVDKIESSKKEDSQEQKI
jgi:F0F1-type ATP synthase assembly protein I